MPLLEAFSSRMASLALDPGPAIVAVSGGPDSVALLDLLVRSGDSHGLRLIVAHADHGIHPDSASVAARVAALAAGYGLPSEAGTLRLGPDAGETGARRHRYAWLETVRLGRGASVILTAHHGDDQIETVAMRFLRGSGPAGLSGMADRQGAIVRPLLPFRRELLARYVHKRGLSAWTDPANADPRHLRSWLRTELLPRLENRLPDVADRLQQVATQAGLARAGWDAVLNELPGLDLRRDDDAFSVAAPALAGYDSALGIAIVTTLGRRAGRVIGPRRARGVLALAARGTSGTSVPLGGGWKAECAFGRLRLAPPHAEAMPGVPLAGPSGEIAWGRWVIRWSPDTAPERQPRRAMRAWMAAEAGLRVRGAVAGERVVPIGAEGRRLLVRCFQDAGVPRSRRTAWPVLAAGDGIVWVPGVCRAAAHLPPAGSESVRVDVAYA